MLKTIASFILVIVLLIYPQLVTAEYVLPYPSYMPGNKLYRISRALDQLKRYWYFGNISQIKYRLRLSDKYLVEAKTLFEYKQYVLALDALDRSNKNVHRLRLLILLSEREKKDISSLLPTIQEDMVVHQSILNTLRNQLPMETLWQPEKQPSVLLPLHQSLDTAIEQRKNFNQFNEQ